MTTGLKFLSFIGLSLISWSVCAMELTSTAFKNGDTIPAKYTCDGLNISPQLSWQNIPANTKSFALIVDDPDAPMGTWVHWVLYNLPANTNELTENVKQLPTGAMAGVNSGKKLSYSGPCPPSGRHHYYFKFYALNTVLTLAKGADKAQLMQAMQSHILAETQLLGFYR
jgi:Raf kinase inhibitor-like YbhB/YbcL family protein